MNQHRRSAMSSSPAAVAGAMGKPAPIAAPKVSTAARSLTRETAARYLWAFTRLCMGWVFLWPFLDKMFGLGHETQSADAIIHGGNPTAGFLTGSVGPFSGIYHSIAGGWLVNVLFVSGLFVIAAGLLLGIFMRFACAAGALMLMLMWSAALPPANNLFMDDHVIYALLLIGLALVGAGNTFGLGRRWAEMNLVQRHPWLA